MPRLYRPSLIMALFILVAVVVAIQVYLLGNYNNFLIFRASFSHLVHGRNLYHFYYDEYADLFLYSPTFALLIAPVAWLPIPAGLLVWAIFNSLAVYFAVISLPKANNTQKITVFLIVLIELVTSLQNMQASPFVAACMVFAFICFERKNLFWAAFWIILGAYIKVFVLAAAILFLLYPQKPKFILSMVFWGLLMLFLPLLVIPAKELWLQYQNWFYQIGRIHTGEESGYCPNIATPLSVMGWLNTWFHFKPPALYVQGIGVALLCLPFLRFKKYSNLRFRYFLLASVLIFCMIFNHIAESPSYIIAVFGVALWFAFDDKNFFTISLMAFAFIFTVLGATDIFPGGYIRHYYVIPYVWKAVPCIVTWFYLQAKLLFGKLEIEPITHNP